MYITDENEIAAKIREIDQSVEEVNSKVRSVLAKMKNTFQDFIPTSELDAYFEN